MRLRKVLFDEWSASVHLHQVGNRKFRDHSLGGDGIAQPVLEQQQWSSPEGVNVHRAVSIVLDRLDLNLPSTHLNNDVVEKVLLTTGTGGIGEWANPETEAGNLRSLVALGPSRYQCCISDTDLRQRSIM